MNWPLITASTTPAQSIHYSRLKAHGLPVVAFAALPSADRAALEELALRLLEAMPVGADLFRICDILAKFNDRPAATVLRMRVPV